MSEKSQNQELPIEHQREEKEKEKTLLRIGLISDTQDIDEPEKIIKRVKAADEEKPFNFVFHLGDLAPAGLLSKLVKEYKALSAKLKEQEQTGQYTDDVLEFKKTIESEDYKTFKETAQLETDKVAIYGLYTAEKTGKMPEILNEIKERNERIIKSLKTLDSPIIHQMGNADKGDPKKLAVLKELLEQYNITSHSEPQLMDYGDVAVISWPSMKPENPEVRKLLEEKIKEFIPKLSGKKQVIILGHEQPFKGPKEPGVYRERIEKGGYKTTRYPSVQFSNIAKYPLEILKNLPPETKMTYVCGHMHDPTEIIEAGIPYLKREDGEKIEMRLFGFGDKPPESYKDFKGRKTFDIIYIPQGEAGALEVTKEGEVTFEKV